MAELICQLHHSLLHRSYKSPIYHFDDDCDFVGLWVLWVAQAGPRLACCLVGLLVVGLCLDFVGLWVLWVAEPSGPRLATSRLTGRGITFTWDGTESGELRREMDQAAFVAEMTVMLSLSLSLGKSFNWHHSQLIWKYNEPTNPCKPATKGCRLRSGTDFSVRWDNNEKRVFSSFKSVWLEGPWFQF